MAARGPGAPESHLPTLAPTLVARSRRAEHGHRPGQAGRSEEQAAPQGVIRCSSSSSLPPSHYITPNLLLFVLSSSLCVVLILLWLIYFSHSVFLPDQTYPVASISSSIGGNSPTPLTRITQPLDAATPPHCWVVLLCAFFTAYTLGLVSW